MLEIIKEIISYIPRESLDDMLSVRIASIVQKVCDEGDNKISAPVFGGMVGRTGYVEEGMKKMSMVVTDSRVEKDNIDTTSHTSDILIDIFKNFEVDYREGKNFQMYNDTIPKQLTRDLGYVAKHIHVISNIIATNNRMGPANVVVVPSPLYEMLKPQIHNIKLISNPLEEYDDKIFILRKEKDLGSCKYHLLTDTRIPGLRESKINKILNRENNREINYSILPIDGHKETVFVISIV